jgi:hypothetical protein
MATDILVFTALAVLALWLSPWVLRRLSRSLRPGDLVHISKGHQIPPPWLSGRSYVEGRVVMFLPGAGKERNFAVVRLNDALQVEQPISRRGDYAVLSLRFRGARWGSREVVAVWLEERQPDTFDDSQTTSLVESHAWYQRVAERRARRASQSSMT